MAPSPAAASRAAQIEAEVLRRISPSEELRARVGAAIGELVARAESAAHARRSPLVRALVAGSAARGTYLADRLDLDLFLLFPPTLARDALETEGMAIGQDILTDTETRYAEHPYLRGRFAGFAVDAVPGYAVEDPSRPLSAVDRTPFHQSYLTARSTPALAAEIRLTKQFLRSLGVYGSEARTAGFSGYLVELLILRFGGLDRLLEAAGSWRLPVHLPTAPDARPRVPEDVALVLDDPVDPHRNVASALSREHLGLFVLAAAEYLARPDPSFFVVRTPLALPLADGLRESEARGTHVALLALPRPPLVDDILFPQLRKAERALAEAARRRGFGVLGTASAAGEKELLVLVEVAERRLPSVEVRRGPPVGIDRGASFLEKWTAQDAPVFQGPYVGPEGELAVEVRRTERGLEALLTEELPRLPAGRDLVRLIDATIRVRPLEEAEDRPALRTALALLYRRRLPWVER